MIKLILLWIFNIYLLFLTFTYITYYNQAPTLHLVSIFLIIIYWVWLFFWSKKLNFKLILIIILNLIILILFLSTVIDNKSIDIWQLISLILIMLFINWFLIWKKWKTINIKFTHEYDDIKTVEEMKKLHWREFEKFIEYIFRKKWFNAKARSWRNDWWIDVDAYLNWKRYVIQCKKWNTYYVRVQDIREFYWAVMSTSKEAIWIFITTSHLSKEAKAFAYNNDIRIWDKYTLEKYVKEFKESNSK